jgi:CRP/FNR family cyclic AMP-dependent transcriptional regulator
VKVTGLFRNPSSTRTVAAGEAIFSAGDTGDEMYGIVEGEVELRTERGVIAKLGPDDVFGEMAIVDGSPRMASAVAISDATLAVIDRRQFLFLVHETPMFALQVMAAMAERLRLEL